MEHDNTTLRAPVRRLVPLTIAARRLGIGGRAPARALRRRICAHERATGQAIIVRRGRRGPGAWVVDMAQLRACMPELFDDVNALGQAEASRLLRGIVGQVEAVGAEVVEATTSTLDGIAREFRARLIEIGPK